MTGRVTVPLHPADPANGVLTLVRDAMAHRTYTDEQRAEALALYETDGPTAVQEQLGIPKQTATDWAQKAGITCRVSERNAASVDAQRAKWEERRLELVHRLGEVAEETLEQASAQVRAGKARDAKDLAVTLGILIDKAQLLSGGPTGRSEHVGLSEEVIADARRNALRIAG